jgi:NAD(P)-dependent dehydrogenase (short-subunit alcohol dehydrogenase family)
VNVLITGATRGLGAALARTFLDKGAKVLAVGRSFSGGADIVADLSQPEVAASSILEAAQEAVPRIDVLINNAAIQGPIGPLWENDWSSWMRTLRTDLLAPIALCRAFAPWMIACGGGSIINLSGGGATSPRPNFTAYATAKSGLVRFSETLAQELLSHNITVNCIAPGAMSTEMLDEVIRAGATVSGASEYHAAMKVRREGGVALERVADLCWFLASSEARAITGKLISAAWDPWERLTEHAEDLAGTDVYTLRRIEPGDRDLSW